MARKEQISTALLESDCARLSILNLGCILQSWHVNGWARSMVLGYEDVQSYRDNPHYLGAVVGRVANRISGGFALPSGQFTLARNEGPTTLHGGPEGLSKRLWDMERDGTQAVRLRHLSPPLDQGFPGEARFEITITLIGTTVSYDMRAEVSEPTPINLAQHAYYCLGAQGPLWEFEVQVNANAFTPTDGRKLPTGMIAPLAGQPFDLSASRRLSAADPGRRGLDLNYCLTGSAPAARLRGNGLLLTVESDQPGLQLYSGAGLGMVHRPLAGQSHNAFCGVCLEPQGFPDAVNQPGFPSVLVTPDKPYRQRLRLDIRPEPQRT